MRLVIVALGIPAPQGSKRYVGHGHMIESSPRVRVWREDVKHAALAALDMSPAWDREMADVVMHVVFTLPRPRSHYRTKVGAEHLLRDGAPRSPHGRPDLDKLIRSTCDALTTAGVYGDDSRVVQIFAQKAYATRSCLPPGVMDKAGARITLSSGGGPNGRALP